MSPNKRKSYLRKLAKRGYSLRKVIDVLDYYHANISRVQTHGNMISGFDENYFEELKTLTKVASEIGLNYDGLLELDTRPFLVGYVAARLKNYDFQELSLEEAWKEAEEESSYDFEYYENTLIIFPEYSYSTYISVYEKQEAAELHFTPDYDYVTGSEFKNNLQALQDQFQFKYVILQLKINTGCSKLLFVYTHKDDQESPYVFAVS